VSYCKSQIVLLRFAAHGWALVKNRGIKMAKYKTEPLGSWKKTKELRLQYYKRFATAHENGGLRWGGGSWAPSSIPKAFGDDVVGLTSEPYAASIASDRKFSARCMDAAEKWGFARDICSYMLNYVGSVLLDEYAFGGPFPRHDFVMQTHICCTHAKWYQDVTEIEGGVPMFGIDMGPGPCAPFDDNTAHRIEYITGQFMDAIDWIEKTIKRPFNEERFLEAVWDELRTVSLWAKIAELNQAVPAPLEEKTLYALFVLATLDKAWKAIPDYYEELYDEVKDRVDRGIAAIEDEKFRVMTDSQPPWGFLQMYRILANHGAISIGSLYTFALEGIWRYDKEKRMIFPKELPKEKPQNREEGCRLLAEWFLERPLYQAAYHPDFRIALMSALARQWKVDGIIIHLNRGCELVCVNVAETRLGLIKEGFKVMTYEGNMGDERDFDLESTMSRLNIFLELLEESRAEQQKAAS